MKNKVSIKQFVKNWEKSSFNDYHKDYGLFMMDDESIKEGIYDHYHHLWDCWDKDKHTQSAGEFIVDYVSANMDTDDEEWAEIMRLHFDIMMVNMPEEISNVYLTSRYISTLNVFNLNQDEYIF